MLSFHSICQLRYYGYQFPKRLRMPFVRYCQVVRFIEQKSQFMCSFPCTFLGHVWGAFCVGYLRYKLLTYCMLLQLWGMNTGWQIVHANAQLSLKLLSLVDRLPSLNPRMSYWCRIVATTPVTNIASSANMCVLFLSQGGIKVILIHFLSLKPLKQVFAFILLVFAALYFV